MARVLSIDARRGDQVIGMMHVVIASEHFMIPFFPILKSVAGGAQSNNRFAGVNELLNARELLFRQSDPADEEDRKVGAVEGL